MSENHDRNGCASAASAASAAEIEALIKTVGVFRVLFLEKVTSTNTALREMAAAGAPEGCVLVAEEQTAGKGRQGRQFHSPASHGVYFSLLLRPAFNTRDALLITPAAAVATALAIGEVYGVHVGIKWVNDLLVEGKKVCGILTETVIGTETGLIESAILGIGINITKPEEGYPRDIADIAAALTDSSGGGKAVKTLRNVTTYSKMQDEKGVDKRCRLIAAILDNFWAYYQSITHRGIANREHGDGDGTGTGDDKTHHFLQEYRARSIVTGRDIYIISGESKRPAKALAVDDDCCLVVEYDDGTTEALSSGEVSVRTKENYES